MILSLLTSAALASAVYVNGVRADVLPEVVLERCTVRLDGQGNVFIDAPGYKVNITDPGETSAGPRAVSLGGPGLPGGAVATVVGGVASGVTAASAGALPTAEAAPRGKWWLVTEDAGSAGQSFEVRVNGYKVRTVRSGEAQLALDLGPWLRAGNNSVEVVPGADVAGAAKGSLGVFIGTGSPSLGVLRLETPEVRYARRPGVAPAPATFQLVVR